MSLFKKADEHAGSGIDKPEARGIVEKIADKVKEIATPSEPKPAEPAKIPEAP